MAIAVMARFQGQLQLRQNYLYCTLDINTYLFRSSPMDAKTLTHLRERLPEAHLSSRLIRQAEHVAMRFDVHKIKLFRFYWENFDLMPKTLGMMLRLSGQMRRATANAIRYSVREHEFYIKGLTPAFDGYRILHLSDLHIDEIDDAGERLRNIITSLDYDLCVITGDYRFDTYGMHDETMMRMSKLVEAINCPDGVIGILGNHDFIEMVPELENLGIRILLNESHGINRGQEQLWLVGLDDAHYYEVHDLEHATQNIDKSQPTVLLVHSPEVIEEAAAYGFDLYLCGHTHGGQVCLPGGLPIIGNARCQRNKLSGRWSHGSMQGYTHRGTGSSGLPVRLNCPPEISIHRLKSSP